MCGAVHELAAMELPDQGLVDLAGGEVEAGQILVGWEAGGLDLVGDGPDLALGGLGLEQLGEDRHGGFEGRRSLFDQSPTAWAMPYILRLRSMTTMAALAGS